MYDRKTWIVLAACGLLIALNIHFSSKYRPAPTVPSVSKEMNVSPTDKPVDGLSVETLPPSTEEETIRLSTDQVEFTLTNMGGGIKFAELKNQKNIIDKSTQVRINEKGSGPIGGFVNSAGDLINIPYTFSESASVKGKSAVFMAKLPSGLVAKKTYSLETETIPAAPYFINLTLELQNTSGAQVLLSDYGIFLGAAAPLYKDERPNHTGFYWYEGGEMHFKDVTKFKGGILSSAQSIISSDPSEEVKYAGVSNQFFSTVIRPEVPTVSRVSGKPFQVLLPEAQPSMNSVRAALALPPTTLAPDKIQKIEYRIFTGPKANTMLRKLENTGDAGEGWGAIMQYGFFGFVSRPLNWLLNTLHIGIDHLSTAQSWGLSIICLTIIVRTMIWPLHAKSTHTMKRMAKLQPKMAELKDKYPDDPNKLNTEMMGLYRKYGINPLGGCLPMLIQIPVFFGFFRMLEYAVELRNQPFLWVNDLSLPDTLTTISGIPINILPIVMAGTSVLQMAMMPKTGDKMQQRIMMFMPLLFFFFCYNYASALALYWTTQNLFSIAQTWLMNKIPEPELVARKDGGKKSWVQRMAEKQAELQKLQAKSGKSNAAMRDVTPPKKKSPPRTGG